MRRISRAIVTFALLVFIAFMLQTLIHRLVFYPMEYPAGEWQLQAAVGAEDLWFQAADGVQLNAWWFPSRDARFATLFLHGNAGNVTHRADHAQAIKAAGSAVLVVDYRGYGKSKGRPSEHGLYLDGEAAYRQLLKLGYSPDRIIVQGESLGTAVATQIAARHECAAVILEAPLASLSKMAGTMVPFLGPLLAHGFDTESRIRKIHVPVLIIHGDADEIVPFSQGQAVFAAANSPKQFWRVHGAHHNDLLYVAGNQYVPHLEAFYDTVARTTPAR